MLLFGDRIDAAGWAGMALIVASGIAATVLRQRAAAAGARRRTLKNSHEPPMYTTLISADATAGAASQRHAADGVRLQLRPDEARRRRRSSTPQPHIPGAVYANLDTDLSARHGVPGAHGEVVVAQEDGVPASGGRHPLPSRERFATWLSSVGFANDMQAVVYDRNGANYCGRLWWMLKWMGHDAVAVLDGGLQAWQAAGGAVTDRDEPAHFQSNFVPGEPLRALVDTRTVPARLGGPAQTVIDARAARALSRRSRTARPDRGSHPRAR